MQDQVAAVSLALGLHREAVELAFVPSPGRTRVVSWVLGLSVADLEQRAGDLERLGLSPDQALDLLLLHAAEAPAATA